MSSRVDDVMLSERSDASVILMSSHCYCCYWPRLIAPWSRRGHRRVSHPRIGTHWWLCQAFRQTLTKSSFNPVETNAKIVICRCDRSIRGRAKTLGQRAGRRCETPRCGRTRVKTREPSEPPHDETKGPVRGPAHASCFVSKLRPRPARLFSLACRLEDCGTRRKPNGKNVCLDT